MWFAHWARSCGYKGSNLSMWQYGGETNLLESNSIPGVGTIDKNSRYGLDIYIDGIYGPQTRGALTKALQKELNTQFGEKLVVDGIFGPCTKRAIRNISQGARGNYTKTLQGFLICNGYSTGGFDGIFGSATNSAVKEYQSKNDLYVDGIAGPATFSSLCT